jgi:proline racemase/trans-L-3-hydroxyproline dehydratase
MIMIMGLKSEKYEQNFWSIDSHTMGEATRIIVKGFPSLPGHTMMERKLFLERRFDHFRTALMLEPRGHNNMFGALLTEPADSGADIGVIFMDSGGYLNMCGHGSMGAAMVAVETRIVPVQEPLTSVVLDTPAGMVRAEVTVENSRVKEVSVYNVPSFLYKEAAELRVPEYGNIRFNLAFGGSFFAFVNAEEIGIPIREESIDRFVDLGMKILRAVNQTIPVQHPLLPIDKVDLVEFYGPPDIPGAFQKNIVVFGAGQFDRSPCGTGTSARIAELYAKGRICLGQEIINESITGMTFRGSAVKEVRIGDMYGVVPRVTGQAYITGYNHWLLDRNDPLEHGFLIRSAAPHEVKIDEDTEIEANEMGEKRNVKARIVAAAWELFREKGYDATTVDDIIMLSNTSKGSFYYYFSGKDEMLETLSTVLDSEYAKLSEQMDENMDSYDKLIYLNAVMLELVEKTIDVELLSWLYSSQLTARQDRRLLDQNRVYYRMINDIVHEGQLRGQLTNSVTAREIVWYYTMCERALIYDWCLNQGEYSIAERCAEYMPVMLSHFRTKKSEDARGET